MVLGCVIGIVEDNQDPEGLHRVKVRFPVELDIESTWCRVVTPMAGADRGLVILPDVGTEVAVAFAYRSLTPYVLGGVYNGGEDLPEPYHNDDGDDNVRIFWSRNDHMVKFDDTPGAEMVQVGAQAGSRLDPTSGVIHQTLDAANATVTEYCDGDTSWEAGQTVSIKCRNLTFSASQSVSIQAGTTAVAKAGTGGTVDGGAQLACKAARVDINGGAPGQTSPTLPTPDHKHPPTT